MSEKTLTRAELANAIHDEVGLPRQESAQMVEAILEEIVAAMKSDKIVKLSSFARFTVREKKQRVGRNPKTKVEAVITPRNVVSFRASSILKDRINGEA